MARDPGQQYATSGRLDRDLTPNVSEHSIALAGAAGTWADLSERFAKFHEKLCSQLTELPQQSLESTQALVTTLAKASERSADMAHSLTRLSQQRDDFSTALRRLIQPLRRHERALAVAILLESFLPTK